MIDKNRTSQIVERRGLSSADYASIKALAGICNEHDNITLKINDFMLKCRPDDQINDFLCMVDDKLVGFLGIFQFSSDEVEISGMIHPAYRRNGYFSMLLERAKTEIASRNISKLVLINAESSITGKLFLEHIGASHAYSEYWMGRSEHSGTTSIAHHDIQLRLAALSDVSFIADAMVQGFQMNRSDALDMIQNRSSRVEKSSYRYVIEKNGTQIGTIAINYPEEARAFLFAFVILPEFQRQGLGRVALAKAVEIAETSNCSVVELEVACENKKALQLYETCGFRVERANDYYVLHI